MTKDEIEKKAEELYVANRQKWIKDHTFKVHYALGNTYITCPVYDDDSVKISYKITPLLKLMEIDFWTHGDWLFPSDMPFSLVFKNDNHAIGDFIQKFIDNGYRIVVD